MNCNTYEKWFETQLLPNIPKKIHYCVEQLKISFTETRTVPHMFLDAIKNWPEATSIEFKDNFFFFIRATETSILTSLEFMKWQRNVVYGSGQLPPYHCELNLVEMI